MTARLVEGKSIAAAVLENIRVQVDALVQAPHMAAVCIGGSKELQAFVRLKQAAAQSVGVVFSSYLFDGRGKPEVINTLRYLAKDKSVDGIFIELPLPASPAGELPEWDADELIALIPPDKDVDALTDASPVSEPAVLALQYVLREYGIQVRGATAAVVGQGRLVGRPIAAWLQKEGARVLRVDIDTPEPASVVRQADLVVTGTGKPGLVTGDWIKEGATVVDFGYGGGKGDVDRESVIQKAGLLTPVPGGMGPLVVAALLENLLTLNTS